MNDTASSLTILKVRRTRKHIVIGYRNGVDEYPGVKFRENPMPAFDAAIAALTPLVCELLLLPQTYTENMKATGLTIADPDGNEQVCVVAQKSLPDAAGPFNIATPLRFVNAPQTEGSFTPALSANQVALIDEVIEQAKAYVRGERAQGIIKFEGDEGEDEDGDEGAESAQDKTDDLDLPLAAPGFDAEAAEAENDSMGEPVAPKKKRGGKKKAEAIEV